MFHDVSWCFHDFRDVPWFFYFMILINIFYGCSCFYDFDVCVWVPRALLDRLRGSGSCRFWFHFSESCTFGPESLENQFFKYVQNLQLEFKLDFKRPVISDKNQVIGSGAIRTRHNRWWHCDLLGPEGPKCLQSVCKCLRVLPREEKKTPCQFRHFADYYTTAYNRRAAIYIYIYI